MVENLTPEKSYFGIHVILNSNQDADALAEEASRLADLGVNLLIVEVNYSYAFASHPELRSRRIPSPAPTPKSWCRPAGVRASAWCRSSSAWGTSPGRRGPSRCSCVIPELDETPGQFPGNQGIYCRSWCPQHPQVNQLVFDLMDEMIDAFEADALHVGMDEVFSDCLGALPALQGRRPGALFARAVNDYYGHLVRRARAGNADVGRPPAG